MASHQPWRFRTRSIHVGSERDPQTGAVVPPIHVASTYVQPAAGEWGEFDYSRSGNPTRSNLERLCASLEDGKHGLAYASGMAAIHGVLMLLQSGDHVLAGNDIYGGTYRLLHQVVNRVGLQTTLTDTTDIANLEHARTPQTRMLWLESPGNPRMSISDLQACADWAHEHDLLMVVDNTFATPVLTRPLSLGADIVVHSATKYMGGHSDALGGVCVVNDDELRERMYFLQNATGGVMSPWDAFLIGRGIKTLQLRVHAQCDSAVQIAGFLSEHKQVKRVYYPGCADHPGHELAAQQMNGRYGAMMSFELDGSYDEARKLVDSTRLFQLAVSLGAVESLIEQPAAMSHASYAPEDRAKHGISDALIRLSIGLEDSEDLRDDLDQAIAAAMGSE